MRATVIDINPLIYLRQSIDRRQKLLQSMLKITPEDLTLGDMYNFALEIQNLETKFKSILKEKRSL